MATAVNFAILLLFPAPIAIALIGLSVLLGNGTLALRPSRNGKRRRGVYDTLFNAALMIISAGVAAAVLYALRPETSAAHPTLADLWAVPFAAAAMYFTNTGLVALIVAIHTRRHLSDVWLGHNASTLPRNRRCS